MTHVIEQAECCDWSVSLLLCFSVVDGPVELAISANANNWERELSGTVLIPL